jgi:lipopolysaccharide transport system permease protein
VILPIELIPTRLALMALISEGVGIVAALGLSVSSGNASWRLLLLPVAIALQTIFMMGLAWLIAPFGHLFPDLQHFLGVIMTFLLFVSPIGYRSDALSSGSRWCVSLNPISWILKPFRFALLGEGGSPLDWAVPIAIALMVFFVGVTLFYRFKKLIADYD